MIKIVSLGAIGAAVLLACAPLHAANADSTPAVPASAKAAAPSKQLQKLLDDYYIALARFEPMTATFFSDNRFDDQLGLSISPRQRARQFALYRGFAQRLRAIDPARLAGTERSSHAILAYELKAKLAAEAFPDHLLPIDQMGNTPILLANYASGKANQPIATPAQYRAYLSRVKQLTPWLEQAIANMRDGMRRGVVHPSALIIATVPQYQKLASASADASVFYTPIKNLPAHFSDADKRALTEDYRAEITGKLNPALSKMALFLEKEYLPAGRSSAGLGALPNGAKWYQARVATETTTSLTPDQVHATGLAEVARIQGLFTVLGPKLGYTGPAAGLPKWVAEQAKFRPFKSDQEILEIYRKLDVTLAAKLPALFTLMPKAPLEQRLEPELTRKTASDHYSLPSPDGTRPGVFWSVVNDPTMYSSTKMTTLFMHEGRPGHHFQLALQLETPLPDFRKFGGNNAFIEGWALYAESLGKEMGMFTEPDQYFGHLNDELLRAARLVVDTGLHANGWTREQAIQYLRDTNGYTEAVAKSAIERYMAWPGQALAYKVGSLKIAELRARASAAMGPKFSVPAFHAIVLGEGTVPLAVLEQKVDRWIAESK
ncbi:MAG: DUF885 domain-containing protein [Pseudomonadota bacterium]